MPYALILIIRFLDILSTKIAFDKYGAGSTIEGNPISAYFINLLGFPLFSLLNIILFFILISLIYRISPITKIAVKGFLIVNLIVIGINFYSAIMI
jgi:hypothetical protein